MSKHKSGKLQRYLGLALLTLLTVTWSVDVIQHYSNAGEWLSYRLAGLVASVALMSLQIRQLG